jgi:cobalt-zinc-cadmium efflux system outer membrane protein
MNALSGLPWLLVALVAAAAPEQSASPLRLDQALALARESNPLLSAARLRGAVNAAGLSVARERPNPELRYERAKETPRDSLGVTQVLETGGKRGRRMDLAEATIRVGEAELAETEVEVLADVERAFFALATAERKLQMAGELRDLTSRARKAADERYDVGDVSRLDVVQAALASELAESEAAALEGELRAAQVDLNFRIGRTPEAATHVVEEEAGAGLPLAAQEETPPPVNTALVVLDRQILEAEARAALARAQRVPDLTLEATATHGAEPEFLWGYRAAIALAIPVFTRHDGQVQVEDASLALLRAQRSVLETQLRGLASAASARATAQGEQYRRYRETILPRAREAEAMAEDSYRSGQTNLTAFIQALQAGREIRLRALQAASDFESARADLRRALQGGVK